MSKKAFHYHVCGDHRWMHKGRAKDCDLSSHAHCGFNYANDFSTCVRGKHLFKKITIGEIVQARIDKKITQGQFLEKAIRIEYPRNLAMEALRAGRRAKVKA